MSQRPTLVFFNGGAFDLDSHEDLIGAKMLLTTHKRGGPDGGIGPYFLGIYMGKKEIRNIFYKGSNKDKTEKYLGFSSCHTLSEHCFMDNCKDCPEEHNWEPLFEPGDEDKIIHIPVYTNTFHIIQTFSSKEVTLDELMKAYKTGEYLITHGDGFNKNR
jgi:hypothetical protein